jgi:ABC-type amino acid transport substrate-binding protein
VILRRTLALAGCVFAVLAAGMPAAADEPPFRVCLQSDDPPLSSRSSGEPRGFDVALARVIAERLGRPLAIQWFVTRRDPDSHPALEANALLSDGRCELVSGYALKADAIGHPRAEAGKLPPFEGAKPEDRRRLVRLGDLAPTRAYRFDALAVVLAPGRADRKVRKLADLADLTVGVETHSIADLIAMSYEQGRLADRVLHFPDARALFAGLQDGSLDAALVGLHQLDAWRLQHPGTPLGASGYTHSIGFNIGLVGLSANGALVARVDATLSDLMSNGTLATMAAAAGVTYVPPRSPEIAPTIPLAALAGD